MKKEYLRILRLELLWLLFTGLATAMVIIPLIPKTENFTFYPDNILFVATFLIYTRLIFFINSSFLTFHVGFKLFFLAIAAPFTFILIDRFNNFQTFLDNHGVHPFLGHLPNDDQMSIELYLRNEMMLFGVGAIILSIMLPLFLIRSIWRFKNRGKH